MKGLIYKDLIILIRGMKPVQYLGIISAVGIALVLGDDFRGLIATLILTLFGSIFSSMAISFDEKVRWRKFEITLPTGRSKSITSKYIVVLIFMIFNTLAAILFFFVGSIFIGSFNWTLLWLQIGMAIVIPLLWSALSIPLTYGIGYQGASYMGVIFILPIFILTKYFEDGSGVLPSSDALKLWGFIGLACIIVIFGISYFVTTTIHNRKEYK